MKTHDDYSRMQKEFYANPRHAPESIVGNYAWHENFPYETNLLYRYADIRLPLFTDPSSLVALDIGCGPGRMVSRMQRYFKQVDGVDISPTLLAVARQQFPRSQFYESNGADLGATPSNHYDFVYSTIALQHIAVNSIRRKIFKDMMRVLKPGGKFTLQFAYLDTLPYRIKKISKPLAKLGFTGGVSRIGRHADWSENRTNALKTNGMCDVTLGPASLPQALEEFREICGGVEHWFFDIRIVLSNFRGASHCDYWASHWIFFHGCKTAG